MIIVLANKSITMHSFTLLSVSLMVSSLNDYWKPLLNHVGSLSLEIYYTLHEMTDFTIHQKVNSQPSPTNFSR